MSEAVSFQLQSEIRREAAGSAPARQGEATTYRAAIGAKLGDEPLPRH